MSASPFSGVAVTLIAEPRSVCLSNDLIARIMLALEHADFGVSSRRTLKPGDAVDLVFADTPFEAIALPDILARCRAELGDRPVDVALQPAANRRKKLLIADMDSTIIGQECLDELADFAGLKAEISEVTERAMRGELQFEEALRARVAKLEGLAADRLEETFRTKITLNPGAQSLVRTMRAHGATTILASGGFTFFTSRVAAAAGFERHVANEIGIADGTLTGKVREPIFGREGKTDTLRAACRDLGVAPDDALAVGDGANDLGMIGAAGLGVAFRAKPAVAAAADVSIAHGDLTALLYIQGYTDAEIIETESSL